MENKFLTFPEHFYWGAATSAHQVEGDTNNDWMVWEKSDERLLYLKEEGRDTAGFISGKAADQYHRYQEDFDIAHHLGHTMHRLSVEWSRIEPREGEFDKSGIQHYLEVVKYLRQQGMEPMVTLWHFTTPQWLSVKGGVLSPQFPELYKRFISQVVDNLKGEVKYWVTFNEATTVYAGLAYRQGVWPPQHKSVQEWRQYRKSIRATHALAYRTIKDIYRSKSDSAAMQQDLDTSHNVGVVFVGAVENVSYIPMQGWAKLLGIGRFLNWLYGHWLWRSTLPYQDFLGLNYYTLKRLPYFGSVLPTQDKATEMDWEIYPEGLYHCLKDLKKFNKPIFITENGIADATDQKRERFIRDHLRWLWQAREEGVDVRGYLYWSLIDNFEWARGFGPRFGLVAIDYTTQVRTIRTSAWAYAKIIKEKGLVV